MFIVTLLKMADVAEVSVTPKRNNSKGVIMEPFKATKLVSTGISWYLKGILTVFKTLLYN